MREARRPHDGGPAVARRLRRPRFDRHAALGPPGDLRGRGAATPTLDALARDGVVFERTYSPCPLTLPAHTSLFTGLDPPGHGVRDNVGFTLDAAKHPTLASLVKARGYATGAAVSAWVLRGATGLAASFDSYDDRVDAVARVAAAGAVQRAGPETMASALAWLDGAASRPFFLFVHLYEPHAPYAPPEPFRSASPTTYDGEIAFADSILGTLVADLRRRDLYDGTLLVVLSDHGEGLGDHGEAEHGILLYRESLQVPLVVKLPGGRGRGTRVTTPASLVDVLPTLAGELGIRPRPVSQASTFSPTPPGRTASGGSTRRRCTRASTSAGATCVPSSASAITSSTARAPSSTTWPRTPARRATCPRTPATSHATSSVR